MPISQSFQATSSWLARSSTYCCNGFFFSSSASSSLRLRAASRCTNHQWCVMLRCSGLPMGACTEAQTQCLRHPLVRRQTHPLFDFLVPTHDVPQLDTLFTKCYHLQMAQTRYLGADIGGSQQNQGVKMKQRHVASQDEAAVLASSSISATRVLVDIRVRCTALRSTSNVMPCTAARWKGYWERVAPEWRTMLAVTCHMPATCNCVC